MQILLLHEINASATLHPYTRGYEQARDSYFMHCVFVYALFAMMAAYPNRNLTLLKLYVAPAINSKYCVLTR